MGSISPPSITTSMAYASDTTYPCICLAKLNAHWPTAKPPFDQATGEFTKWSIKLDIFLQQSGLDQYIFTLEKNPSRLIMQPDSVAEPNVYANWLSNNDLIISIICAAVSESKLEGLKTNRTAKECYNALKARKTGGTGLPSPFNLCTNQGTY